MEITRGEYPIADHHLVLELADDLHLAQDRAIYYLCGDNGLGKTTFVEKVLIPALSENEIKLLYLGQDIGLQLYTLRASLAVAGHGLGGLDEESLLRLWIHEGHAAEVLLADEFDKYDSHYGSLLRDNAGFLKTIIMVSHGGPEGLRPLQSEYRLWRVPFRLQAMDGGIKRVRVTVEASW